MNLLDYLKSLTNEQQAAFAAQCQTSAGQLKQVAYGHRRASAALAINVERASDGVVRCEDLRPDIDWAYLRGTAAA